MNENINLCEILKDCPINTGFYSPLMGNCKLNSVNSCEVVVVNPKGFLHINPDATATIHGYKTAELMLLPSQTQRDWSKWQCPKPKKPKFDPKTLQPFDRVLARINDRRWYADFISIASEDNVSAICTMSGMGFHKIIPYNEDTKHLAGTNYEAPEYYRYWED